MTIPLIKESDEFYKETRVYERCYFCDFPTAYWHKRTNNPVCPGCSKLHMVEELPNRFKGEHGEYKRKELEKMIIFEIIPTYVKYGERYEASGNFFPTTDTEKFIEYINQCYPKQLSNLTIHQGGTFLTNFSSSELEDYGKAQDELDDGNLVIHSKPVPPMSEESGCSLHYVGCLSDVNVMNIQRFWKILKRIQKGDEE